MFGTIRRHQKWLWLAIVIPTIVTFVWYFGPTGRVNSSTRRAGEYGALNGQKITESEYAQAVREVELHYFFNINRGHWPEEDRRSGFDLEQQTYQWLLILQKQQQLGIHVGPDLAADAARQMVRRFEREGVTSPTVFIQRVLLPHGIQVEDFERFLRHFVGLEEMMELVGSSGMLVTPQEAQQLYQRDHEQLATDGVFFFASNYVAEVPDPAPPALGQYYTNMMVKYAVPERVQVSYVRFNVTNFFPEAQTQLTNLNEMVEANLQRLGTNLYTAFPEIKTPEAARAKLRDELIRKQALSLANKKAMDFANVLFAENEAKARPGSLAELARSNGLPVEVSLPFDRDLGATNIEAGAEFTKRAFDLTPDEPFSQPISGHDGVYIMALDKQLPREMPTLEQIRPRVITDYKLSEAMRLSQQAARGFYQTLTNGLAQGSTFTNLCAAAKIKPAPLPPFALATRDLPEIEDLVSLNDLKQTGFTTPVGKVSAPKEMAEGSYLLYVRARLPVDPARMQTDLPNYITMLRRNREQEAFQDWFRREWERNVRNLPLRPKSTSSAES